MKGEKNNNGKAWIVSVDMGYGHQRAAYPLKRFAYGGKIINASNYPGMPKKDHKIWQDSRKFYEFVSRFKKVPFFGELVFDLYDKVQEIPSFYPKRDLSKTNFQQREIYSFIKKYKLTIAERLGKKWPHSKSNRPPTITFAVGGAGAQRELGVQIVKNLSSKIKTNEIKIVLVAGIRNEINQYFRENVRSIGLGIS